MRYSEFVKQLGELRLDDGAEVYIYRDDEAKWLPVGRVVADANGDVVIEAS